jgi:hypothetical protein
VDLDLDLAAQVVRVGPMDRVGLRLVGLRRVGLRRVGLRPVGLRLVVRVGLVDLTVPVARVGLDRINPAVPVGLARVVLGVPVARVDLMAPVARVGLDRTDLAGLVVLAPVAPVLPVGLDRMARVVPAARVGLGLMDLVGRAAPLVLGDPEVPVVPVVPVVPNMAVPVGPNMVVRVVRVVRVDRHRRRMCNTVSTTVVARSGVDRGTRRTASARPITARRPRHRNTDSGGTVDLLRELRHPTGTGHRLLAAGTGRRPPVAGIPIGTGPDAT